MSNTQYLDMISMIEDNFHLSNNRYTPIIKQEFYDNLGKDIFYKLKNIKFDNKYEKTIFDIVFPEVYSQICIYLSCAMEEYLLKDSNIKYDKESSNTFHNIVIQNSQFTSTRTKLTKSVFRTNWKIKLYHKLIAYLPMVFFKNIVLSKSYLLHSYQKNKKFLLFYFEHYKDVSRKNTYKELENIIIENIIHSLDLKNISNINQDKYSLYKSSIKNLISINEVILEFEFIKDDKFLNKLENKIIHTGTGAKRQTRLLSYFLSKKNKIFRFSHGGDRCFFNDITFNNSEFYKCDTYCSLGDKEGKYLYKNYLSLGSHKHRLLYSTYFDKNHNNTEAIMYCSGSYVGEIKHFFDIKFVDTIYFDWQLYLVNTLQSIGKVVSYKKHPKGFFQAENIVAKVADYEINYPMNKALDKCDKWIFDVAGSAFVEALCAGKDVIYIDMNQRPFNKDNFEELNEVIKIIKTYEKDGLIYVDEKELLEAINSTQKDKAKQRLLVNDYWLSSSI